MNGDGGMGGYERDRQDTEMEMETWTGGKGQEGKGNQKRYGEDE